MPNRQKQFTIINAQKGNIYTGPVWLIDITRRAKLKQLTPKRIDIRIKATTNTISKLKIFANKYG